MIIVKLFSGLGNQIFQYALYRTLQLNGKDVRMDVSWNDNPQNSMHDVRKYFQVDISAASEEELEWLRKKRMTPVNRLLRKICKKGIFHYYQEPGGKFYDKVLELDDCYIEGYWQSPRYFEAVRDILRQDLQFIENMTDYQKNILEQIKSTDSVSVHIRRGDYLIYSEEYGNICTDEYYEKAISKLNAPQRIFYVFSNDYEYAKEKYQGEQFVVVKPESEYPACNMDMLLMSQCKHNIIANSSFSWWGAWFNPNPDKIVIAPSKWNNRFSEMDIWCDGWIRISGK